jgi:hypothetical protein
MIELKAGNAVILKKCLNSRKLTAAFAGKR